MSAVRVTVLMENTAPEGLLCEHGLSLMIEHGGRSILLDAGSSAALLDNAARLGVDLSRVDAAVLSHGHYDHSGGFCAFFQRNPSAPLYLREEAVALGRRLLELGIGEIWTGHCTGTPAFELLRPVLGERLHALSTGSVVEL